MSDWKADKVIPVDRLLGNTVPGQPWPMIHTGDGHLCCLNEHGDIVGYPIYQDKGGVVHVEEGGLPDYWCLDEEHVKDLKRWESNLQALTATIESGNTTKEAV